MGGNTARFKSKVLRHLVTIDQRFEVLVRLVKLWAKVQGLNSPQDGTFNSFCLNLMVSQGWQCNCTFLVLAGCVFVMRLDPLCGAAAS